jgi:hypothetical protein
VRYLPCLLGELLELPKRPETPTPLPSQLGTADVEALEALTAELQSWAQRWGGGASTVGAIAQRSERLLSVSAAEPVAAEPVRVALDFTLAKLHTVAGWAAFDEQLDETACFHFARAMSLAGDAADPYWIAFALYGGGRIVAESGHPNDALKYYQLLQVALAGDEGRHSRAPILTGYLHSESAPEYAALGHRNAINELAIVQENPLDADSYNIAAETHVRLGNLDIAHRFATSAAREWIG